MQWIELGAWLVLGFNEGRLRWRLRQQQQALASLRERVDAHSERLDAQTKRLDTHEQRQGVLAAIQGVQSQRVTLLVSRVNAIVRRLGMSEPLPPNTVDCSGKVIVEGPVGKVVETPGAAPISVDEMIAKSRTTRETEAS